MRTGERVDCFMSCLMGTFIAACSFCGSIQVGGRDRLGVSGLASGVVNCHEVFFLLFQKSLCFIIQAGAQCWCVTITLGLTAFCRYVCHSLNDVHFYVSIRS